MELIDSLHPTPKAWLRASVLAPHCAAFIEKLRLGRYAEGTSKNYVSGMAHFSHWMTRQNLLIQTLDGYVVKRFLNEHIPRCDCPNPVVRVAGDLRATLGHLLVVLREQGGNTFASITHWRHR